MTPPNLASLLTTLRSTRDLSRLMGTLGYTEDHQGVEGDAVIVARWRGFHVVAAEDPHPRERALGLARTLATVPGRGMAISFRIGTELAVAAPRLGAAGVSRVLVVGLRQPTPQELEHLGNFAPRPGATGLAHALHVDELLASELAGERFFAAFRVIHDQMTRSLSGTGSTADRRLVALLALTRVLFLYFVQAKGWLDRRRDYLRRLLDDALQQRRHFHRSVLSPLCFGVLNAPPRRRGRLAATFGRVPYLNGGLFERHPVERRLEGAAFDNALWRAAFDNVFERFRFCVREAHEVDAIAPDMLGHVFQRVMNAEERHASGTFYTPEVIVTGVVDAAIETALVGLGGLDEQTAREIVAGRRVSLAEGSRARTVIETMRVLDPAVGSGAFLLAALDRLTAIRCALDGVVPGSRRHLDIRHRVLRSNLFGVDLNPVAVRLAELRLWLAVVADDPTTDVQAVSPLPNLDGVVRQGDSLLDPLGAARALGPGGLPGHVVRHGELARRRDRLFAARGRQKAVALRCLRAVEHEVAGAMLARAHEVTAHAVRDLTSAARGRDLFGARPGLPAAQQRRLRFLRRQRRAVRDAIRALNDGTLPFFSYDVHAADVLADGGYSIVVGNPPWVRAERLGRGLRETLKDRFRWWAASGSPGGGYAHLPDISLAFLERALELARPGGAVAFLMPSKLVNAGYAQTARREMVRETTIRYLHRVPDREANLFGATTYPLAIVLGAWPPGRKHPVRLSFSAPEAVPQRSLSTTGPWVLLPDAARDALDELRAAGRALVNVAAPALGVKTGANDVLVGEVDSQTGTEALVRFASHRVAVPRHLVRRVLRGRDVRPFGGSASGVVVWAYDESGKPLARVPDELAAYVARHRARLARRADYRDGPLWALFRTEAARGSNRVIWADIARRPKAVALDATSLRDAVPLNSCYVSVAPDRQSALVIAAVLNSTWVRALVTAAGTEARGGYRRWNAGALGPVPVPPDSAATRSLAELSLRAHSDDVPDQTTLDEAVAETLGLSAATRAVLRRLAADHR